MFKLICGGPNIYLLISQPGRLKIIWFLMMTQCSQEKVSPLLRLPYRLKEFFCFVFILVLTPFFAYSYWIQLVTNKLEICYEGFIVDVSLSNSVRLPWLQFAGSASSANHSKTRRVRKTISGLLFHVLVLFRRRLPSWTVEHFGVHDKEFHDEDLSHVVT